MRTTRLVILALLLSLVAVVNGPTVGAELSAAPTTWGVSGLATGTQTDGIKSEVWAMEQIGNVLYVGGRFTDVTNGPSTTPQPFLAAFDATTGAHLPGFTPQLDNAVYALEAAPDGSRLFVGGVFTQVNGQTTKGLVALDPNTGNTDGWSGRIGGYNLVRSLDLVGDHLYVVGGFNRIESAAGASSAGKIGRFDWRSGTHDSTWQPTAQNGSVWGVAASPDMDRVYLVGYFDSINGVDAPGGFKAVTKSTGAIAASVEDLQVNTMDRDFQYAYDVVVTNGLVYIAGSQHYVQVLNESDLSLRKFHMSQPSRGDYQELEVVGDRVYAGCHCRQSSYLESSDGVLWWGWPWNWWDAPVTSSGPNSWVTAFDAATGDHIQGFVPDISSSGPGIWAIHGSDNNCAWFGGNITAVEGVTQYNIARMCDGVTFDGERPSTPAGLQLSGTDAQATLSWQPSTDNVGVVGYRVYNYATGQAVADVNSLTTSVQLPAGDYSFFVKAYDAAGNTSWRTNLKSHTFA